MPQQPQIVDARGHHCPVPTLRLRKAIEKAAPGAVVKLLADDPMAKVDVPHFAAEQGLELLSSGPEGAAYAFTVRKPA